MASVIRTVSGMQQTSDALRTAGKRIAVVPTMGALHEGHLSLVRLATRHADAVVTTVFVNPAQFGPGEDFERYPRDLARDAELASGAGSDIVFAPGTEEMYPDGSVTSVCVDRLTDVLEGKSRPGHFRGVTTVVAKLFHLVRPHVAVFGQKDAQQVRVIRRMVRDLNFDVAVLVAPTSREPDGLARSSRNVYLSGEQRAQAPVLYRSLKEAENVLERGERDAEAVREVMRGVLATAASARVDYVSVADDETLEELESVAPGQSVLVSLAVRFGSTRLIDNIQVRS